MLLLQSQRAVDGRERVAAADMVLEGQPRDVEVAAQRGADLRPVGAVAHGLAQAGLAFQHVERTAHAAGRQLRGQHAGLGGAARMQRLGHGLGSEGLLQPGGERGGQRQGVREGVFIQAQQAARRRGRTEAAHRPGVVPEPVVRPAHHHADAGGDFVAQHHRTQEVGAGGLRGLRRRKRRRNGGGTRVVHRIAEAVVHLGGMGRRAVDQGCGTRGGRAAQGQACIAPVQVFGHRGLQHLNRRHGQAGIERGIPVDHGALRVVQHFGRQRAPRSLVGKAGEDLRGQHRQAFVSSRCCTSPRTNPGPLSAASSSRSARSAAAPRSRAQNTGPPSQRGKP